MKAAQPPSRRDAKTRPGFSTTAIHAGQPPDGSTGAVAPPIFATSTYAQTAPGVHKGFEYSRTQNPTRLMLDRNLAALEGGAFGLTFASGMAAMNTVLNLLSAGDHVICGNDVYGGTYRILEKVFRQYKLSATFVDTTDPRNVEKAIKPATKLVWIETPTNPLLRITDIQAVSRITRKKRVLLAVDNTFATPYLQRPLAIGADIVAQSTTKYLGGHSDVMGGALIVNDADLYKRLAFYQNAVGAVPSPFDCFLILRGTKTLAVRMRKHCENAMALAEWLARHPLVAKVLYPGLPSHPQHALARKQMCGFGGMIAFELKRGSVKNAEKFASSTRLFTLGESLGGVESLIVLPCQATHVSVPPAERKRTGLVDHLIRLSVGIEDADDLIADLAGAFSRTFASRAARS